MVIRWIAVALCLLSAIERAHSELLTNVLWYEQPARDWEREALPIGNGALGAMIFGGVEQERVQFNEKTLWTGGPGSRAGYDFGVPKQSLTSEVKGIAEQIDREHSLAPEYVASRLSRKARGFGEYQTFGDVLLEFAPTANLSNYKRELDIDNAIARVSYESEGVRFEREYFASYPDNVIVIRLMASDVGRINVRARFSIPENRSVTTRTDSNQVRVSGALHDNGLRYAAGMQLIQEGGTRSHDESSISIKGASSALIVLTAATNYRLHYPTYRGSAPQPIVQERLHRASEQSFEVLRQRHVGDYAALFARVKLDVGQRATRLPSDRLLSGYGQG